MKKKIYLTLQNGKTLQGYAFGAEGDVTGELVFSTGMVGYIETLTDPANYGQIVVQTFPLIGNYGMMRSDVESDKAWVSAYVVREICDDPSNFRMEETLEAYLKEQGVVGIHGVDTRELTKILREEGAINARISKKPLTEDEIKAMAEYKTENAVEKVAPTESKTYGEENANRTLALWNFGARNSTVQNLVSLGAKVVSVPYTATAEEILALGVDGIVISDGPGDPKDNAKAVAEIKKVLGKLPTFGIGLGHQLVALALGGDTVKHKYGHRGSNQPVKCVDCGRVYISTQNHGFEVVSDSVKQARVKFVNVNDGSCEGLYSDELKVITTQFVPECCNIGNPENPLYKKFFAMMK